MRFHILCLGLMGGLIAACTNQGPDTRAPAAKAETAQVLQQPSPAFAGRGISSAADAPDRGGLVQYRHADAIRRGPSTWHPVEISEAHALNALARGAIDVPMPDGSSMRVHYERKVLHPDGNWTFIGKGDRPGEQAVLTFGDRAVFGSLPTRNGIEYRLASANGRTWLVATDTSQVPAETRGEDYIEATNTIAAVLPKGVRSPASAAAGVLSLRTANMPSPGVRDALISGWPTVDIVLGYTSGFATRLGGQSQAVTRLRYLVDLANTAYTNSPFQGQLRLVRTVEVAYPDATSNRSTLFELTGLSCTNSTTGSQLPDGGVTCTAATVPASLQPLRDARETYGADLVGLVRNFNSPENQSCGIGWLNGGGQSTLDQSDADFGFAVISDTNGNVFPDPEGSANTCREDTLVHEFGHTMGLQHDREAAAETDDSNGDGNLLDPEEFGAFPYSFGYSTDVNNGNFFTVMSVRLAGQTYFRTFSNPNSTFCGGVACGNVDFSDNVRSLETTFPIVASFRAAVVDFADVPENYWAYQYIRLIADAGITSGCSTNSPEPPNFCPEASVTREQMAVFLVRAMHGSAFSPPAATGMFADVPASSPYAPWVEQLANDGVTSGCGGGNYCPSAMVSRETMAVFLLRAKYGSAFSPSAATGVFDDVPTSSAFAPWIERLFSDGVTSGCSASPPLYCPAASVTRAQMAVFLSLNFGL